MDVAEPTRLNDRKLQVDPSVAKFNKLAALPNRLYDRKLTAEPMLQ
jgi:hypothetical protein